MTKTAPVVNQFRSAIERFNASRENITVAELRIKNKQRAKEFSGIPHFETPPGVVLRMRERGEQLSDPVLVCEICRGPRIHDHQYYERRARCRTCGGWRPW